MGERERRGICELDHSEMPRDRLSVERCPGVEGVGQAEHEAHLQNAGCMRGRIEGSPTSCLITLALASTGQVSSASRLRCIAKPVRITHLTVALHGYVFEGFTVIEVRETAQD